MKPNYIFSLAFAFLGVFCWNGFSGEKDFRLKLTQQKKDPSAFGGFRYTQTSKRWKPEETAIIVCDMWDAHHSQNATRRGAELAPRLNDFLTAARSRGALIIHAPSSCMDFYRDHPSRKRAMEVPKAENLPKGIDRWLPWLNDQEKTAGYPIDDSDGGEDDDPKELAAWKKELKNRGRKPEAPWKRQTEVIEIDPNKDAITDRGIENWNLLEANRIKNVLLVGVHVNMCVLGRPFGLRQMVRNGKNVALVRDLTDSMYNPKMKPYLNHFAGTDLVVNHIEKYICPTISSDQLLGGSPFSFSTDPRKHIIILIGEKEYRTNETLPIFARRNLIRDFRITIVHADSDDKNRFSGIGALQDADILLVSVRRRTPSLRSIGDDKEVCRGWSTDHRNSNRQPRLFSAWQTGTSRA